MSANQAIIGSDNALSPARRQAIIWTNDNIILQIRPLGTNFSEILIEIQIFSLKKIHSKMAAILSQLYCVKNLHAWYYLIQSIQNDKELLFLNTTQFLQYLTNMLHIILMCCFLDIQRILFCNMNSIIWGYRDYRLFFDTHQMIRCMLTAEEIKTNFHDWYQENCIWNCHRISFILYHTWVWNRGICMCVIVRPRSHMLIVLKKVIPDTTRYDFA